MNESESESESGTWSAEGQSSECEIMLVQQIVGVIVPGIVILLGLSGNTISFVLLTRTKRTSMFIILQSLLLSDSVVLLFYFVSQILPNLFELVHAPLFIWAHKVHGYLLRTSWPLVMTAQMTSVWLNVLISVERWFAVCKPFTVGALLTRERTSKFVTGIFAGSLVYNLPRYFEYDLCVQDDKQLQLQYSGGCPSRVAASHCLNETDTGGSWTWTFVTKSQFGESDVYANTYCAVLYCLVMFFVPLTLIGALNTLTIVQLHRSRKQWRSLSRKQKQEERITLLPIWIVGLFCLCSTPSSLINIIDAFRITLGEHVWETVMPVTNLLVTLNSAINCVVYCAFTRKFRQIFLQVFCSKRHKAQLHSIRSTIRSAIYDQQSTLSVSASASVCACACQSDGVSARIRRTRNSNGYSSASVSASVCATPIAIRKAS